MGDLDRAVGSLGSRLRRARLAAGISARELDRRAGLAEGHTSLIEAREGAGVVGKTAVRLARALGVSVEWLMTGIGPGPDESSE